MPKISVIVPVYNVEPYLRECLESILVQTFDDFELILVDDGSTDNCPIICEQYAQKDNRVVVIHKENGGLSSARNVGIDNSCGEYISFIDSDDFVAPSFLNDMLNAIRDCDLCICYFDKFTQRSELGFASEIHYVENEIEYLSNDECMEKMGDVTIVVAWNKLYKRNLFKNIRYPEGKIHEDDYVIHRVLGNTSKIAIIPKRLYHYRIRTGSIISNESKETNSLYRLNIYSDRAYYYCFENSNKKLSVKYYRKAIELMMASDSSHRKTPLFKNSYRTIKKARKYVLDKDYIREGKREKLLFFSTTLYFLIVKMVKR